MADASMYHDGMRQLQDVRETRRLAAHVGLLFIDFENQKRLRVNATAQISADDPLRAEYPGSVFIVRMTASRIFPVCPRYIHKMQLVELSVYVPKLDYTPPLRAWKAFDEFRDALPARDRVDGSNPETTGKPTQA